MPPSGGRLSQSGASREALASGKREAPATRSWVSWVSCVSWQGASHAQRASRLPSEFPPARMPLASGRTARKGFRWKAGGQDTQDHQDTQDVAGPQVGGREAQANGWQVTSAKRGPVAGE